MLINLFIFKDLGERVYDLYFGECHSFPETRESLHNFIQSLSVLYKMSQEGKLFKNKDPNLIEFSVGDSFVYLLGHNNLIFAFLLNDKVPLNQFKEQAERIASLFFDTYSTLIDHFSGDSAIFKGFYDLLIEHNLAEVNCGQYSSCEECPIADNTIDLDPYTEYLEKLKEEKTHINLSSE